MILHTYSDGGARGNPGPAAAGAVVQTPEGEVLAEVSEHLGETTNNQAEYKGVIFALEKAKELGGTKITAHLDSELAVKQLNGEYKVKNSEIAKRFLEVKNLLHSFERVTFVHVRRENNKHADALVNKALDRV